MEELKSVQDKGDSDLLGFKETTSQYCKWLSTNCSSDREKLLKFEAKAENLQKF